MKLAKNKSALRVARQEQCIASPHAGVCGDQDVSARVSREVYLQVDSNSPIRFLANLDPGNPDHSPRRQASFPVVSDDEVQIHKKSLNAHNSTDIEIPVCSL